MIGSAPDDGNHVFGQEVGILASTRLYGSLQDGLLWINWVGAGERWWKSDWVIDADIQAFRRVDHTHLFMLRAVEAALIRSGFCCMCSGIVTQRDGTLAARDRGAHGVRRSRRWRTYHLRSICGWSGFPAVTFEHLHCDDAVIAARAGANPPGAGCAQLIWRQMRSGVASLTRRAPDLPGRRPALAIMSPRASFTFLEFCSSRLARTGGESTSSTAAFGLGRGQAMGPGHPVSWHRPATSP